MGSPRKYFCNESVLLVTFSLEQGLLLLANPLSQTIIKSCLARALALYKVKLCHFIVHTTHIHMLIVVVNPTDACSFIGHFKAEVAHRINALFGWKKRTIWCEGYDSPVVLTPLRALIAIAYLYLNPAKDCQVDSIDEYPGVSSWKMFTKGEFTKQWGFIRRTAFRFIAPHSHNLAAYSREAARLSESIECAYTFELSPNAWLEAFGITEPMIQKIWNDRLINRVKILENRIRAIRSAQKISPKGRDAILKQPLTFSYKPERSGRRVWCLSEKRSVRIHFIQFLKKQLTSAKEVYRRWRLGDYSLRYPPGLFAPCQPRLVELLSAT